MAVSIILTFLIECVKGEARLKTFSVHIFLNWVILCSVYCKYYGFLALDDPLPYYVNTSL